MKILEHEISKVNHQAQKLHRVCNILSWHNRTTNTHCKEKLAKTSENFLVNRRAKWDGSKKNIKLASSTQKLGKKMCKFFRRYEEIRFRLLFVPLKPVRIWTRSLIFKCHYVFVFIKFIIFFLQVKSKCIFYYITCSH